jgi:transcriptional regulator with XRE-family HTH domain
MKIKRSVVEKALSAQGLTVRDLCDRLGVTTAAYYFWLTGAYFPRGPHLDALAKILGRDWRDLVE